ncbi:MAG: hypothetical protein JSW39_18885 [Desulfobacterales bacterium]|nr:MAG: hypothetical protein JSW39_18885 [Desulfobacterales bacterium]
MAIINARSPQNSDPDPHPAQYTSMMLQFYLDALEKRQPVEILDVGPVCQENIRFFAQRVRKLHVCDMFLRLDRERRQGLPLSRVWRHLDYPFQSFDGIQLWSLIDHLDNQAVKELAERCHHMLKLQGLAMVIALEEQTAPQRVSSFVIGKEYHLSPRPQTQLDLPWYFRHNRALESLMAPLKTIKSFRYRNGTREFLFQRE